MTKGLAALVLCLSALGLTLIIVVAIALIRLAILRLRPGSAAHTETPRRTLPTEIAEGEPFITADELAQHFVRPRR